MTFKEKHAGKPLPPMGKKLEEKNVVDRQPDSGLIPLLIQGLVVPVTEQEALGLIGQITSILQSRRSGVYRNG